VPGQHDKSSWHLGQAHPRTTGRQRGNFFARERQLVSAAQAVVPLQAADETSNPELRLASSIPLRVSLVNLQKFTFHA
jgi:hypothetical protein